jgi:hypothetical protein
MSYKHLRRTAHHVRRAKWFWWYEHAEGITGVVDVFGISDHKPPGKYTGTIYLPTINWSSLRAALKRKDQQD